MHGKKNQVLPSNQWKGDRADELGFAVGDRCGNYQDASRARHAKASTFVGHVDVASTTDVVELLRYVYANTMDHDDGIEKLRNLVSDYLV